MSLYARNLAQAIVDAVARVPTAEPSQIAGYWANREFWVSEFQHLLLVIDGYESRLCKMRQAQDSYLNVAVREQQWEESAEPKQRVRDTTNSSSRRFAASEARVALKRLADRALDLKIATLQEYNEFVKNLRITNRDD